MTQSEQTDSPISAIDVRTGDGYIHITREDGSEHGMFYTHEHAQRLAEMHGVPLTVDGVGARS